MRSCCDCANCPCKKDGVCLCHATPSASSTTAPNSGCLCVACAHTSELLLSVLGMTCASCVSTVKNALKDQKGVSGVTVNLLGEQAQVLYYPHLIQPEEITELLDDIGFEATAIKTSVHVRADAASAELRNLSLAILVLPAGNHQIALEGVRDYKVASGRLFVEFYPAEVSIHAIRAQLPDGTTIQDVRPIDSVSGVSSALALTLHGSKDELRALLQTFPPTAVVGVLFGKHGATVSYFPHALGARKLLECLNNVASFDPVARDSDDHSANLRLFLISLPWTVVIITLVIFDKYFDVPQELGVALVMSSATILQFYCGSRFHKAALNSIRTRHPTMDVLVSVSTNLGYLFGIVLVTLRFTGVVHRSGSIVGDLAHDMIMSAVLITVLLLGKSLEDYVKRKTAVAMRNLRSEGRLVKIRENGAELEIHASLLHVGDDVILRPGDCAPCDGIVTEGDCGCDEALLTGESEPIRKKIGDTVLEGSTIADGYCILRAREVGAGTTLAQIRRLMEEAQLEPTKIQRVADSIAAVFVPGVLVIAALTWVVWTLLVAMDVIKFDNDTDTIDQVLFVARFGLSVMLIACPCSFGLATPAAVMVATGVAAKFGCLVKSGRAYETVRLIRNVVLDKTGTITHGRPQVVETILEEGVDLDSFKQVLASAERFSEHPIGKSLAALCASDLPVSKWCNVTGKGVECLVGAMNVSVQTLEPGRITTWSKASTGATLVGLTVNDVLWGGVALRDSAKPEARAVINALQSRDITVWMCTGDSVDAALEVAKDVGIEPKHVRAKETPEGKAALVGTLNDVLMVGDGINDSIALAKADLGVAIGSGNHITMDSADVVLVKNDLNDLKAFFDLSHATVWTIYRNFVWAFGFNIVGIPIAAGIGYPFGVMIPPIAAGFAMASSSIMVVCSSLLLYRFSSTAHVTASGREIAK